MPDNHYRVRKLGRFWHVHRWMEFFGGWWMPVARYRHHSDAVAAAHRMAGQRPTRRQADYGLAGDGRG